MYRCVHAGVCMCVHMYVTVYACMCAGMCTYVYRCAYRCVHAGQKSTSCHSSGAVYLDFLGGGWGVLPLVETRH